MTETQRVTIGFDRRIDIEWLDAAAGRLAMGQSQAAVREFLWSLLRDVVAGESVHSARGKTLTVLARIWLTVPTQAKYLRDGALECIRTVPPHERIALHWAMCLGCYPFFFDVAASVGKLLSLHGSASLPQVARRMTEIWGDRSTLPRAIQRVLRSMVQWDVLLDGPVKGTFGPVPRRVQIGGRTAELLIEALLVSQGSGIPFSQAISHPAIFPFDISVSASAFRSNARVRVFRQGDQADFLELAKA